MIGSFESGATASMVAKSGTNKIIQMSISQPFEELQGLNSEFKLITPKSITTTYSDTKLSMFGLASLLMVAILDFQKSISQSIEELQG